MTNKPHHLRIETDRLKNGPLSFESTFPPEFFDLLEDPVYEFHEEVSVNLKAYQAGGNSVVITGDVKTVAQSPCVRCLNSLRVPVTAKVTLVYMHDDRLLETDRYPELVDDDSFYFDGEAIYPMEQLREFLLLELPNLPACEVDEKPDVCSLTGEKLPPRVYGPADAKAENSGKFIHEETNPNSWKAQMKQIREKLGE